MFTPGQHQNAPSYSSVETFTNSVDSSISNRLLGDAYEPKWKRSLMFILGWVAVSLLVIGQFAFFTLSQRGFIYVEKDNVITTGVIMSVNNTIITICLSIIAAVINRTRLWTFRAQLRKHGLSWKILKYDVFPNQLDTVTLIPYLRQLGSLHSVALFSALAMLLVFPFLQTSYKWVAATMESPRVTKFMGIRLDMWEYHRIWLSMYGFPTIDFHNEWTLGTAVDAQVSPHKLHPKLASFTAEKIPVATFSTTCRYPENVSMEADLLTRMFRNLTLGTDDELERLNSRMNGNLFRLKSVNGSSTATGSSYSHGFLKGNDFDKMQSNHSSMDLEIWVFHKLRHIPAREYSLEFPDELPQMTFRKIPQQNYLLFNGTDREYYFVYGIMICQTKLDLMRPKTKLIVQNGNVSAENDEWESIASPFITFLPLSLNSLNRKKVFVGASSKLYNLTGTTNLGERLKLGTKLVNSVIYGSFANLNYYMSSPYLDELSGAVMYNSSTSTIDILRLQINPIVLIPVILISLAIFALCFLIAIWQKKRDKIAPSWLGFLSVDLGDDFKRNLIYHTEAEDEDVVTLYTDGSVDKLPVIDLMK